jgi:hypothetical protein
MAIKTDNNRRKPGSLESQSSFPVKRITGRKNQGIRTIINGLNDLLQVIPQERLSSGKPDARRATILYLIDEPK